MTDKYYKYKLVLAFTGIYIIWGSTYIANKIALQDLPPFLFSALRFFIGAGCLAIFCFYNKEKLPSKKEFLINSLWGAMMFTAGVVPAVWAQQYLPSYIVGCIITSPFWFVILDKPNWKANFSSPWVLSGVVVGFVGVGILLGIQDRLSQTVFNPQQIQGIIGVILGSLGWVLGSLVINYRKSEASVYIKTCIQLFAAGVFISVFSFSKGEFSRFHFSEVHLSSLTALVYLAVFSTTLSFLGYIWLMKVKSPAIVSTYAYVNPVVAVFLGVLLAGETVKNHQILGLCIILLGVLFVNMSKYRKASK